MTENPYKVLELERTADERAIKKAYVVLLRKFTPEAHPEEFKRIRAAYELLSDADARARFDKTEDGYDEYDAELARKLKDVDEAEKESKPDLAHEILVDLETRFPDALVVKEKLGFSHLGRAKFDESLAQFSALAEREKDNARHQLHRAMALGRLKRFDEAEVALAKAYSLAPGDARVASLYSDFLGGRGKVALAVAVADETLPSVEQRSPAYYTLWLRKLEAYAMPGDERAARVGEHIAEDAQAGGDAEVSAYLANQIAQTAARLFATKRPRAANALLALCVKMYPAGKVETPYPYKTRLRTSALSPTLTTWLRGREADNKGVSVTGNTWFLPCFCLVAGLTGTGFALRLAALPASALGFAELAGRFALLAACACALVACVRWVLSILGSPLRALTTIHPLYLMRVKAGHIDVYSLFTLTDVKGVHHHTNGVYTATNVTLRFGEAGAGAVATTLSIRGKQLAEDWLGYLHGIRGRSLELLAEGFLEADGSVELLPPKDLTRPKPSATNVNRKHWTIGLSAAVGIVAAGTGVVSTIALARGESLRANTALTDTRIEPLVAFIAKDATSPYRPAVEQELTARFQLAKDRIAWLEKTGHPGAKGLMAALEKMRASGAAGVRLVAADPGSSSIQSQLPTETVARALASGALGPWFDVRDDGAITVQITETAGPLLSYSSKGGRAGTAAVKSFIVTVQILAKGDPVPLYQAVLAADPSPFVVALLDPTSVNAEQAQRDRMARAFAHEFGLFAGRTPAPLPDTNKDSQR